jgi:hypothetical protein
MVVIPCQNTIAVQTVTALMQLQLPPGSSLRPIQEWTSPAEKRNHAISILLATPHLGWAFFCDSDMLPPPDTVRRLLATGCDVVGGLYTGRVFDPQGGGIVYGFECGYVDRDNRPVMPEVVDQLAPVDWVGAGALLVRRHVLEKLAPGPWFGNHGQDDIDFCGAARAAGFSVHVDGRVPVGHLQLVPVMPGASMFLDLNLKSKPL